MIYNSVCVEIFQSLGALELRNARKWIENSAQKPSAGLLALFDYVALCVRKKETPDTAAAIKVALDGKSDEKALRRLLSELTDMVRDFLVWQQLQEEPLLRERLLLRQCRSRGLTKNGALVLRDAEKVLDGSSQAQLGLHLADFQVHFEQYQWNLSQRPSEAFPFEQLANTLNAWYAGQLMQLACMAKSNRAFQRQENEGALGWTAQVVEQLPSARAEQVPAVGLYHKGYLMLSNPQNGELLAAFRADLGQYSSQLPSEEARGLLMMAINQCIRRINEGDRQAIRDTLEFYLLGLESGLLLDERGNLSRHTYYNILNTYLALEDWANADAFLSHYRDQLEVKERENTYGFNRAVYHYRKGEFDQALILLREVTFPDSMYNLESRKMLLKIYYEQGELDALTSLIDNLLTWLRRHGELGYHREMFRNLARFTNQLLRIAPGDTASRQRLAKKRTPTPLVAERAWLLGKVHGKLM
jgi:hypothetical protein